MKDEEFMLRPVLWNKINIAWRLQWRFCDTVINLLAVLQKSLDRALFLYIFIREARSSGVRASIAIVHIRKFYKMHKKNRSIRILL